MAANSDTFSFLGIRYLRGGSRTGLLPYALAFGDQLPRLVLPHARRDIAPPVLEGAAVAVAKIDHLGDLLMATPLLAEVRRQTPTTRIELIVGSWCGELANRLSQAGLCHEVLFYDHWALNRGVSKAQALAKHTRSARETTRALATMPPAAFVDLRTRSPSALWLAARAGVRYRVGFGLRGLSYTLNAQIPYAAERSLGQLYLDALPLLGLEPSTYRGPILKGPYGDVASESHRPLPEPYIVAHLASGNVDRNAADNDWRQLLTSVAQTASIVAVGSKQDRARFAHIGAELGRGSWINLMGQTSIAELAAIVRDSSGGIAVDSLVAHLLIAYRRPAIVLMRPGISQRQSFPEDTPTIHYESSPLKGRIVRLSW
jgi:ADP-heptose:LPS heptosyltransferase